MAPATLTIAGTPVFELPESGALSFSDTDVTGVRIFRCDWKKRVDVVREILGFSVTDATTGLVTTVGSRAYSVTGNPALFAKTATALPLVSKNFEDSNKESETRWSIITVQYKIRQNSQSPTRDPNTGVVDEGTAEDVASDVLLAISATSSVEVVTIPDSTKIYSFRKAVSSSSPYTSVLKDGTLKNGFQNIVVPFLEWTLSYSKIEKVDFNLIRAALTNPLHTDEPTIVGTKKVRFDDGKKNSGGKLPGFEQNVRNGSLMFQGINASKDAIILGPPGGEANNAWNISFKIKEHPYAWNYIFRGKVDTSAAIGSLPRFGWWPPLSNDNNDGFYGHTNFNDFLPKIEL